MSKHKEGGYLPFSEDYSVLLPDMVEKQYELELSDVEEGDEVIYDLLDSYNALGKHRGVNRFSIFRELLDQNEKDYEEIAECTGCSRRTVRNAVDRFVDNNILDEDLEPRVNGKVLMSGFNDYARVATFEDEKLPETYDDEISSVLSSVTKFRPQGNAESKLHAFLLLLDEPERSSKMIAQEAGMQNGSKCFQRWLEEDLVDKYRDENGRWNYSPTSKAWGAEGMISSHFTGLKLKQEFLDDVQRVEISRDSPLPAAYRRNGVFNPEWFMDQFGFESWENIERELEEF